MAENVDTLLRLLSEGDDTSRIEAARAITRLERSSDAIVRALECVVLSDPSEAVQQAVLAALATPVHHRIHRSLTPALYERQTILRHVDQWASDGLLTPQLTALLKGRYTFDLPPLPEIQTVQPAPPALEVVPEASELAGLLDPQKVASSPPLVDENPPLAPEDVVAPLEGPGEPAAATAHPAAEAVAAAPLTEAIPVTPTPEIALRHEPAEPELPAVEPVTFYREELLSQLVEEVEPPLLDKQKFSLIGTFTSEVTIKIALYLGAFLIVSAAVIFAGLVEPARFPMLTLTVVGFFAAARTSKQRLTLGSFALFIIGTLLIPPDAAVFFALVNLDASPLHWAVVAAAVGLIWARGTYTYRSRLFGLAAYVSFSAAVYLAAASQLAIDSNGFLLVIALVALGGLAEARQLRLWQGDRFFEPVFYVVQLQALGVLCILVSKLAPQVNEMVAAIGDNRSIAGSGSGEIALLGAWLTLAVFYWASDHWSSDYLTRRWTDLRFPVFPLLAAACLVTPPVLVANAISASPHEIATLLWGWGALAVVFSEALYPTRTYWTRTYSLLFLCISLLSMSAASVAEYITTLEYAAAYFLATSLVCFGLTYRRKQPLIWIAGLVAAYPAYLAAARALSSPAAPAFWGYALTIPTVVFFSVELAGRRQFRATPAWTQPPLLLGLFNLVWHVALLLTYYGGHPGHAAVVLLIYGTFGALYAALDDQRERGQATIGWSAGLVALYAAYLYLLPNVKQIGFGGSMLLAPALVFLSAELAGKRRFHAGPSWTQPLLALGLFNVAIGVPVTLAGGLQSYPASAAGVFLILGLFGLLYAKLDAPLERDYALIAWIAGLTALYVAYAFVYRLPEYERRDIFPGYFLLLPMLAFLSAELVGKLRFALDPTWTRPLLAFGLLNAALVVPVTLNGGMARYPGSASAIFLVFGLFGLLYAKLDAPHEREYAVTAWSVGLIALYVAYGFVYRLPEYERLDPFTGYFLLLPALVFLSAELLGKLRFRLGQPWTLPLLGLGVLNVALAAGITLAGRPDNRPGSAAITFLVLGLFGLLYTVLDVRFERRYAIVAWTSGLIALYAAYAYTCYLLDLRRLDLFPGFYLLVPALVFLSLELAGKLRYRLSWPWTRPLLGLGLLNVALAVLLTAAIAVAEMFEVNVGYTGSEYAGSAVLVLLIFGLFGLLYTKLDASFERDHALVAWVAGLTALYAAYGLLFRLPAFEDRDIFPGFIPLVPALAFLSAELVGKLRFKLSPAWTQPLLAFGLFSAALLVPVTLDGGLNRLPAAASAVFLSVGLFGLLYAKLDAPFEREYAVASWTAGLIALYAAYAFVYRLPAYERLDLFPGYFLLLPALVFLSAELLGKLPFRLELPWTLPLLALGVLSAALVIPVTLEGGLDNASGSAALTCLIYGLFGALYAALDARDEPNRAVFAWIIGLIGLYAAYGFIYLLPAYESEKYSLGFMLLLPALGFLSAELVGKLHFRASRFWTAPLLWLGLLNAALAVPAALAAGWNGHPGEAVAIFLLYGLFAALYAVLVAASERTNAVVAWTIGLIALNASFGFVYFVLQSEGHSIFAGFVLLVPALVLLSAELAGRLHYHFSRDWTQPLLVLGVLNAVWLVPLTLGGGLTTYPGSSAIIFLIYGLFAALYGALDARPQLGVVMTSSITLALGFALLFYDQERWVLPFTVLALLYYLGGLALVSNYRAPEWPQLLRWSGLVLGTAAAVSAPLQAGGGAVVGMGLVATVYGVEAFRRREVWWGLPANALFLGAYLMALQRLDVAEPQFYSIGIGLMAVVTHYLLTRRTKRQDALVIGFATGVTAQIILLGTSFMQMGGGLTFFFILFFQSLVLLAYGLAIHSLSFTIVPILFVVGGVLRVVFTLLASYSTVITIGCTGFALVLLGFTALLMRERLAKTYEGLSREAK